MFMDMVTFDIMIVCIVMVEHSAGALLCGASLSVQTIFGLLTKVAGNQRR